MALETSGDLTGITKEARPDFKTELQNRITRLQQRTIPTLEKIITEVEPTGAVPYSDFVDVSSRNETAPPQAEVSIEHHTAMKDKATKALSLLSELNVYSPLETVNSLSLQLIDLHLAEASLASEISELMSQRESHYQTPDEIAEEIIPS